MTYNMYDKVMLISLYESQGSAAAAESMAQTRSAFITLLGTGLGGTARLIPLQPLTQTAHTNGSYKPGNSNVQI